jgi:hypothetical protein
MEYQTIFANSDVTYKEFLAHISKGGTIEDFALLHSSVTETQLKVFLSIGNRLQEFHAKADEIKNAQKNLPVKQGKKNVDEEIALVRTLSAELISEMESFRYSIQDTEFFSNTSRWIDNLLAGCRKVKNNPFDKWNL